MSDIDTQTVPVRRGQADPLADLAALGIHPESLDPEAHKLRERIEGTPLPIGAATWTLADFVPCPGEVWDRLYDHNIVRGQYDSHDVRMAALWLLLANYDLPIDQAVWLILAARPADLVEPVERALFGVDRPYRGYSEWVETSLYANGLDPAKVPPARRRAVVEYLVAAGRAVPASEYLSSHKAAARRQAILDFAARRKERAGSADGADQGTDD